MEPRHRSSSLSCKHNDSRLPQLREKRILQDGTRRRREWLTIQTQRCLMKGSANVAASCLTQMEEHVRLGKRTGAAGKVPPQIRIPTAFHTHANFMVRDGSEGIPHNLQVFCCVPQYSAFLPALVWAQQKLLQSD